MAIELGAAVPRVPARPRRRGYLRELRLLRGAIEMVAIGGAPRVSLTGLHFAEVLAEAAAAIPLEAGVRVVAAHGRDNRITGLVVELDPSQGEDAADG